MKRLFQKLTEYGITMIIDPKPWMNRVYIWFRYRLYESDPIYISIDEYEKYDFEDLLLDELDYFLEHHFAK